MPYADSVHTLIHEMGHNFGANHANLLSCIDSNEAAVSNSPNCKTIEYADIYSPMGSGNPGLDGNSRAHHHAAHLYELGWITDTNVHFGADGTFQIHYLEELPTPDEKLLLLIPLSDDSFYAVDYRQPKGLDLIAPGGFYDGVNIRKFNMRQKTALVNVYGDIIQNTLLRKDHSFVDDINGIKIIVNDVDGQYATVTVERIPSVVDLNNPIVHYTFDEPLVNGRIIDNAGHSLGGVPDVVCPIDGSLILPGGSLGFETPSLIGDLIQQTEEFTVSASFKWEGGYGAIVDLPYWIKMFVLPNGAYQPIVYFSVPYEGSQVSAGVILHDVDIANPGEWHDMTITYDGTAVKLYVDEVLKDQATTVSYNDQVYSISQVNLKVVPLSRGLVGNNFIGEIDDIKIYAKALD